jgi:hypothetical protein
VRLLRIERKQGRAEQAKQHGRRLWQARRILSSVSKMNIFGRIWSPM